MTFVQLEFILIAILLILEWVRRSTLARVAAVLLTLVIIFFAQPNTGRAYRRALSTPKDQRIVEMPNWGRLSEFTSGVFTMERAMDEDIAMGALERFLGVTTLVWLSLSPILRRKPSQISNDHRAPVA
jgi:hypothetical protein